jgi:hypothetical protein
MEFAILQQEGAVHRSCPTILADETIAHVITKSPPVDVNPTHVLAPQSFSYTKRQRIVFDSLSHSVALFESVSNFPEAENCFTTQTQSERHTCCLKLAATTTTHNPILSFPGRTTSIPLNALFKASTLVWFSPPLGNTLSPRQRGLTFLPRLILRPSGYRLFCHRRLELLDLLESAPWRC